jgi:hypothetical protein
VGGEVNLARLRIAAARHVLGIASTEELQRAADELLDQGLHTHSLGELATRPGLILSDAGPLLKSALRELGVPLPSEDDAINNLLEYHVRAIIEAEKPVYTALSSLYFDLHLPTERARDLRYSRDIDDFISAYFGYDDLEDRTGQRGPTTADARDREIVELAIEWNRQHGRAKIDHAWLNWNSGTVRRLAETIQQEHSFDRLPVLADALDEAGCANEDILTHCRQSANHDRTCWVVELILARAGSTAKPA